MSQYFSCCPCQVLLVKCIAFHITITITTSHHHHSETALDNLGSGGLHRLYMATGAILAKLSEYADQSGHNDFVSTHRNSMRSTFEKVKDVARV